MLAVGCAEAGGGADGGDGGGGGDVDAVPRIVSNALTPAELWGSNLVSGELTSTNLATMAATADGRATLHYAIVCALGSQQSVSVTVGGTLYTYQGSLGIAGTWTTMALSTTQQQWVTACILSLTNLTGASLSISIRGSSLGMDSGELTTYTAEEGAFWGNMFLGAGSYASACNGLDQAEDDSGTALALRECAEDSEDSPGTTPCGFIYGGLCTDACTNASWYAGCFDGIHSRTNHVVTSFLVP